MGRAVFGNEKVWDLLDVENDAIPVLGGISKPV
jgi:hypothetical protein